MREDSINWTTYLETAAAGLSDPLPPKKNTHTHIYMHTDVEQSQRCLVQGAVWLPNFLQLISEYQASNGEAICYVKWALF